MYLQNIQDKMKICKTTLILSRLTTSSSHVSPTMNFQTVINMSETERSHAVTSTKTQFHLLDTNEPRNSFKLSLFDAGS